MRALAIAAAEHKGDVILVTTADRVARFRELVTELLAARRFSYARQTFTLIRGKRRIVLATFVPSGIGGALLIDPEILVQESATAEK